MSAVCCSSVRADSSPRFYFLRKAQHSGCCLMRPMTQWLIHRLHVLRDTENIDLILTLGCESLDVGTGTNQIQFCFLSLGKKKIRFFLQCKILSACFNSGWVFHIWCITNQENSSDTPFHLRSFISESLWILSSAIILSLTIPEPHCSFINYKISVTPLKLISNLTFVGLKKIAI